MPGGLQDRPAQTFDHWPYLRAFNILGTCRGIGMDLGPIPWSAINDYATRRHMVGVEYEVFEAVILALDADSMNRRAEERASADEKKKADGDKPPAERKTAPPARGPLMPEEQARLIAAAGRFGR